MRKILCLLLALSLFGCGEFRKQFGRQPGHTMVTFAPARGASSPLSTIWPLNGGMMVIMKTDENNNWGTTVWLPNDTTPVQISVPNGVYHAGAIGWEGVATPPCTPGTDCFPGIGQSKCGIAFQDTPFALTGAAITIPITLRPDVCQLGYAGNSTPFSDVAYNPTGDAAFPVMRFNFPSPYNSGSLNGAVYVNTYEMANGVKARRAQIKLGCFSIGSGYMSTQLRLPVGKSGDQIFSYSLAVHPGADTTCANAPDFVVDFDNGFVNPPTRGPFSASSISYGSGSNTLQLNF